ncbi:putative transcription factor bHLH family [Helianthus debilis subsp. tardiflorus]
MKEEDSADIDLLLSFEEEEYEEEELSTARTIHGNDSRSLNPRKTKLGLSSFSHKSRSNCEGKRDKIRKMVNSLRGIVPGGNRMDTIAVIDEAVKYLKSTAECR